MEVQSHLTALYRHWGVHTAAARSEPAPQINGQLFADIERFIHERMRIWERKTSGEQPPFTDDAILSQYRFCNIYRELDRQTIAFHELLNPFRDDFPLWLVNMFACRMIARPETSGAIGLLSFNAVENELVYKRLMNLPRPRFGVPYVFPVSVIQKSPTPTRELFITTYLPRVMQAIAKRVATYHNVSVYDAVRDMLPMFGYNLSFLWTEVFIDVAYQFPGRIDLFGRFPVGPGALPTFKKIDSSADPSSLAQRLCGLPVTTGLTVGGYAVRLSAENWEGIGCEFRKYTNLSAGKGRKRRYH